MTYCAGSAFDNRTGRRQSNRPTDQVLSEQTQSIVQPSPTPPVPAKVRPSPCRIAFTSGLADRWVPLSSHPCLPCRCRTYRTAGPLRSTGVTPFHRYYGPIRHPLVVGPLPGAAGYRAYPASAVSGRDEEGFSSCSMCPWNHAVANHPAGADRRINRFATGHADFALPVAGSASGATPFRGHHAFTSVTA